jgi:hypothetical protein
MTPKEKAGELYSKMYGETPVRTIILEIEEDKQYAKKCALIAVNEIFEHIDYIFTELEKDKLPNKFDDEIEYWNEVKKEIELL